MPKTKHITIKDVALSAGVSIATVSKVLNGETNFSAATQKRIWSVAHGLGYEPNPQARKLRNGASERTKTNLIMRVLNLGRANPIGDRVTADSVQIFDWVASQHGLFTTTYRYYQLEGFRCPLLLDRLIDGVVICSPHQEVFESIVGKVPCVALEVGDEYHYPSIPRINTATSDGLREMLIRARSLGHSRVAIVGAPEQLSSYQRKYFRAICNLSEELDLSLTPDHFYQPVGIRWQNHDAMMAEVTEALIPEIRSGRISLIVGEDMVYAESVWQALKARGIRVPEEVSILSVNSSCGQGQGLEHEITSVAHDWIQLSTSAVEVLQDMIAGKGLPCSEFLVAPLLNWGTTLGVARA